MDKIGTRVLALLAYVLNVVGVIYIVLAHRKNTFAVHHARQSLGLTLLGLGVLCGWVVVGWVITWIPYVGFVFAMACFALVLVAYLTLTFAYLMGLKYAFNGSMQPVPIFGILAERLTGVIFGKSA